MYPSQWQVEAELERVSDKIGVAYGQVCELYLALRREGRAASIQEIDSLRQSVEASLPWLDGKSMDEAEFLRTNGRA